MRTAVLGGGLTGLTLGYLMRGQRNFEILEKNQECGGLMRSIKHEGFTFDQSGPHTLFSKSAGILNFMLGLLGDNRVRNRRNAKILFKGNLVKYPFENSLSDLTKEENFECLYGFINNLLKREKGELQKPKNLKEMFNYVFGETIAAKHLIPYSEKIWKHPVEEISTELIQRFPVPSTQDVVKSSLGIRTERYAHQPDFYYPRVGGIQALVDALKVSIEPSIVTSFEVSKICEKEGRWAISNGKQERLYERIVSTIPVQTLVEAIDAPKRIKMASDALKCISLITVMISLRKESDERLSWLYIPDNSILAHRVSFPSNFSPEVAPKGMASIMAEVTCKLKDKVWNTEDEKISERIVYDLCRLKIFEKRDVCFTIVKRTEYAYVINDVNYRRNIKMIKNYFAKRGIDLVGRSSEFEYLNMDDCIKSAMEWFDVTRTREQ